MLLLSSSSPSELGTHTNALTTSTFIHAGTIRNALQCCRKTTRIFQARPYLGSVVRWYSNSRLLGFVLFFFYILRNFYIKISFADQSEQEATRTVMMMIYCRDGENEENNV